MEPNYPGCREAMRQAFLKREIPPDSADLMISSLAKSSVKIYESGLKKWWMFCHTKNIDPFSGTVNNILAFLQFEFDKGASRGTLNSYRSAVALIVKEEIGQDRYMKRFFKALSNVRPSKPRYNRTWDPKIVLDYLSALPDNPELTLEQLSMKLATLLALVTAHRMQTLCLISIDNIRILDARIEIPIPERIKTSGHNKDQPYLRIPFFVEKEKICAARSLKEYLKRTKDVRKSVKQLFISFKKPYRAVTAQTLGRWIKSILKISGVDTSVFTAYSTRHASTSMAKEKGVNIDLIKKTAGWTIESKTFARFYDLPIEVDKDQFAKAIASVT